MFCDLPLWLAFGLALLSPLTWLPIPQHSTSGIDCVLPPHPRPEGHTWCGAHTYFFQDVSRMLSIFGITLWHAINMIILDALVWPEWIFRKEKAKKVFMVLKALVCFAHYAYSTFAITICLLLFHSCRLHHLFHSCLFSSFLEKACHYSVFF